MLHPASAAPDSNPQDTRNAATPPETRPATLRLTTGPVASPRPLPDGYAPGPIRDLTDDEADAVALYTADFPEFAGQPLDVIRQHMNLRTRQAARAADLRSAEGIPEDWRSRREDEGGIRMSDDV